MSLRLKLPLVLIAFVVIGLGVSAVFTYESLSSFLVQRLDQQLDAGAGFVIGALNTQAGGHGFGGGPDGDGGGSGGGAFGSPLPGGTFGEILDRNGKAIAGPVRLFGITNLPAPALPSNLPAAGRHGSRPFTVGSVGGSSLRYRVQVVPVRITQTGASANLVVAVPLSDIDQTLTRLRIIEALVAAAVLIVLGLLTWWLVRRELRPLEEMGDTAGAIAEGDLTRRVPQADPRTEVGQLGVALNGMLAQIEQAFAERKASEDRLRRFLADASHELRTPLTSIRGYAELFRRGARDRTEDLEKSMRRIEEESARMGILVEDLLLLARLDQSRALHRGPVDLTALAADAVEDAHAADPDRRIDLEAAGPVVVSADDARIRQVAANLLSNAMVHTPAGTPVVVRVSVDGADAILEVADSGAGMTPEQAAKAFEPFYRSDPSRDRTTGGAGLGLSIVAAISEAHGGRVEVDPTPGGGATFRVVIPREPATAQADVHPSGEPDAPVQGEAALDPAPLTGA